MAHAAQKSTATLPPGSASAIAAQRATVSAARSAFITFYIGLRSLPDSIQQKSPRRKRAPSDLRHLVASRTNPAARAGAPRCGARAFERQRREPRGAYGRALGLPLKLLLPLAVLPLLPHQYRADGDEDEVEDEYL